MLPNGGPPVTTEEASMRPPRLADVAGRAGVSEATVSRVLNDKPGVSDDTRAAVLAAVDLLGYDRPPKLRRSSAGLVGLVVPELVNPVFPAYVQCIGDILARGGYTPIVGSQVPGGTSEDEYVEMMRERGVSGLIFLSGLHADSTAELDRYRDLVDAGLPIVCINGYREDLHVPFVSDDDIGAMGLGVRCLTRLGHRRIGLATGPLRFVPSRRKVMGFRQAMAQHADVADVTDLVRHTLFTVDGGREAGESLIDDGCTAVICGSDMMALGVLAAARARGLEVPGDVSVIGYDDSPVMAFTAPPMTTVRQDTEGISRAAVTALLDAITGRHVATAELVFRNSLVQRESVGPAPRVRPRPAPRSTSG